MYIYHIFYIIVFISTNQSLSIEFNKIRQNDFVTGTTDFKLDYQAPIFPFIGATVNDLHYVTNGTQNHDLSLRP